MCTLKKIVNNVTSPKGHPEIGNKLFIFGIRINETRWLGQL